MSTVLRQARPVAPRRARRFIRSPLLLLASLGGSHDRGEGDRIVRARSCGAPSLLARALRREQRSRTLVLGGREPQEASNVVHQGCWARVVSGFPGAVCSMAIAGVAISGCGGDASKESPGLRGGAPIGSIEQLSTTQFTAIVRTYEAALPLDRSRIRRGNVALARVAGDAAGARQACGLLDPDDPVLAQMRSSCPAVGGLSAIADVLTSCSDGTSCKSAVDTGAGAIRRHISAGRQAERALQSTKLTPACQQALITPEKQYAAHERFVVALREAQRALVASNRRRFVSAMVKLEDTLATVLATRSGKRLLAAFRAHCR